MSRLRPLRSQLRPGLNRSSDETSKRGRDPRISTLVACVGGQNCGCPSRRTKPYHNTKKHVDAPGEEKMFSTRKHSIETLLGTAAAKDLKVDKFIIGSTKRWIL